MAMSFVRLKALGQASEATGFSRQIRSRGLGGRLGYYPHMSKTVCMEEERQGMEPVGERFPLPRETRGMNVLTHANRSEPLAKGSPMNAQSKTDRVSTLRLLYPEWQGGVNPDYYLGAQVLASIVPPDPRALVARVPVSADPVDTDTEDGVVAEHALLRHLQSAQGILAEYRPRRVITLGGDCSVSLAPFDYLSGCYEEGLGVLWLDAHPDISDPSNSTHLHEMVVSSLIGCGAPHFMERLRHPIEPERIMYAGLICDELRPQDRMAIDLGICAASPEALQESTKPVLDWVDEQDIRHVAIHFDLDVLDPDNFRSIYPAETGLDRRTFGAAIGRMTMSQVGRILRDVSAACDMVGLTVAEHLPWDAFNLRRMLGSLPIFGSGNPA